MNVLTINMRNNSMGLNNTLLLFKNNFVELFLHLKKTICFICQMIKRGTIQPSLIITISYDTDFFFLLL